MWARGDNCEHRTCGNSLRMIARKRNAKLTEEILVRSDSERRVMAKRREHGGLTDFI